MTNVPDEIPASLPEPADTPAETHTKPVPIPADAGGAGSIPHLLSHLLHVCSSTLHCKSWVSYCRLMGILLLASAVTVLLFR